VQTYCTLAPGSVGLMADQARATATSVEERLLADNMGLVLMFARRFDYYDADYLQEAVIDLWRALKAYDPSHGCKFSTLAFTYMNRGAMRNWKFRKCEKRGGKSRQVSLEQLLERIGPEGMGDDEETEDFDISEPFNAFSDQDEIDHNRYVVSELLRHMSPRGKEFVLSHYFDGETLQVIGDRHGISRERVRQIIEREVQRCRELLKSSPRLWP
jgi:RNA polymerase sigma factor (sigma-70 family)